MTIGVLHSLSGTMADSERPLVDALTLAMEEINHQGGVLGRPLKMIVADTQSDEKTAALEAKRMLTEHKAVALFGCWTSSCRKAVKEVVEQQKGLLFYPLQYEGMEQSPNIIYTGAVTNQQIVPAVNWALENLGKKIYLVGSDYVFPRSAHALIKAMAQLQNATIVGESYLPLGAQNVAEVLSDINQQQPDVVLNTINGSSNLAFFAQYKQSSISHIPVLSFSIAESGLVNIPDLMTGHYAAWGYFQSVDREENRVFVAAFRNRFGAHRVVDDPMEASYIGLKLWAQGVKEAESTTPGIVDRAILRQSTNAPQGIVSLDSSTRHTWRTVRIGRAQKDGQFVVVWTSERTIRPEPFPNWFLSNNQPLRSK
ncbi:MAG: urea ABC transporter substrate-binding protein [Magnetococcales bacterium]|nr:urea ABC transporter substrate-binding protein [Magnetococcales bacterium]